jgi:hypothetical protein
MPQNGQKKPRTASVVFDFSKSAVRGFFPRTAHNILKKDIFILIFLYCLILNL